MAQTIAVTLVYTSTALLVVERLGFTPSIAGLTIALQWAAALLVRFPLGDQIDRRGPRVSGTVGGMLAACGAALFAAAAIGGVTIGTGGIPAILAAGAFLLGIGSSSLSTSANAHLAQVVPAVRRAEGIGYFGIFSAAGMGIAGAASLTLFRWEPAVPFYGAALLFLVAGAAWLRLADIDDVDRPVARGPFRPELAVLAPAIATYSVILAQSAAVAFVPVAGVSRGIQDAGVFFVALAGAAIVARLFTGRIADARGRFVVAVPAMLLDGVGLLLISQASTPWTLAVAGGIVGVGFVTAQSTLQTLAVDLVPRRRVGSAIATLYAASDLGVISSAVVAGLAATQLGYTGLFLLMSAAPALGVVALGGWRLHRGALRRGE